MYDAFLHAVQGGSSILGALGLLTLIIISINGFATSIRNVYYHPLSGFPGPKFAAASRWPYVLRIVNGRRVEWTNDLHSTYGEIVRIAPDELSFINPSAWHDIFFRRPQLPRDLKFNPEFSPSKAPPLVRASDKDHARHKRILAHAFSDKALREQEYILLHYIDLLVSRLKEQIKSGDASTAVDICDWYNYTTFDIIGDLCFGESFHSLENMEHHPWVANIFKGLKTITILMALIYFPPADSVVNWCMPQIFRDKIRQSFDFSVKRIDWRLQQKTERPDIMAYIMQSNSAQGMTRDEIDSDMEVLILAGSETTATALSATTWFLLKNRETIEKLQTEIRGTFRTDSDITVSAVSTLPYLHAVLTEALRIHPPAPITVPRMVDSGGVRICGVFVPEGTIVSIPHKTANLSPRNFADPEAYVPERWLPDADPKFAADRKDVMEPFQVGPRSCIGRNLAWAEMKLALAKLVWNFELELAGTEGDWADQRVFTLNEKKPLNVRLSARL